MKAYIGITDGDWYAFLAARRAVVDEVNFWQPGGNRVFRTLNPGELFLFKLHSPNHFIVGGGVFAHSSILPVSLAWDTFGEKNGATSLEEMRRRVSRYRRVPADPFEDYRVGCILLTQPFFFPREDWIKAPHDWGMPTVQGASYDLSAGEGKRIWEEVLVRVPLALSGGPTPSQPAVVAEPRFGSPTMVSPRLGQGTFRVVVIDAYERRCTVTGERTLPVLEAAHIRPYGQEGPHDPRNGLLLRSDLHTLFDRGYVTVSPDRRVRVSRRTRDEFENGRDYYGLHDRPIRPPVRADLAPGADFLEWHGRHVFRA